MKNTFRIKKNRAFRYVFKNGDHFSGEYVVVHTCKTKYSSENIESSNFFAVCVSKKNGNSVERNRLKRYAREVYKQEEENISRGYNIVIVYKKDIKAEKVNFNNIKEDIIKCFEGLNLYEKNN